MKTVVVIGGGITGLTTMYYLQQVKRKQNLDVTLILIERNDQLGGKIATVKKGEYIMETGADSIVANKDNVIPLIEELDLQDEIVYNSTGKSYIYVKNNLMQVPEDTVFGIPTNVTSLFNSPFISFKGKVVALKDFVTKNHTYTKDSSIGAFLESFLGKELVENQISPILSGVYSGKLDDLLISSTIPYLLDYKNKYGSIIRGLSKHHKPAPTANNKKFLSFKNGLATVIERLEEKLTDVTILKGIETTSIQKDNNQYIISCTNHEDIAADYIVLSTSHDSAKNLLQNKELDTDFNKLKNSSLTTIYMGFDIPDDRLPADGTGFINSGNSDLLCNACTWTSRKWPNTSKNQQLLVRLFYKSSIPTYEQLDDLSEDDLIKVALEDVQKSLGISEKPKTVEVTKWNNLMPNYNLNHGEAIKSLNAKLESIFPQVILAGSSYYGVGIPACITNGKDIAEKISNHLAVENK